MGSEGIRTTYHVKDIVSDVTEFSEERIAVSIGGGGSERGRRIASLDKLTVQL